MKTKNPVVSILLPVFNCGNLLTKAVESVKKQTFDDWELIIIDDGSDVETKKLISKIVESDHRIKILQNTVNKGIIYSLNKALDFVNSDYVARIDCDDLWLPDKLEKQIDFFKQHPDYVMVATWSKVITFGIERHSTLQAKFSSYDDILNNLMRYNFIVHSSILYRTEILKQEQYSKKFLHAEDYELWLRTASKYNIYVLPEILTIYNFTPDSVSYRFAISQQFNVVRLKFSYLFKYPHILKSICYISYDIFMLGRLILVRAYRRVFPKKNK